MKKRVISLILTFALVLSMAAVGIVSVSAADESSAESSADTNVYFKVPDFWTTEYNIKINDIKTTVWFKVFGINPPEGFAETAWQAKSVKCKYDAEKDLYYFDTAKLKDSKGKALLFEDGYDYGLIFSARNADTTELNPQTCDIIFSTDCVGDTVYVTTDTMENTMDSKKKVYLGYWTNPDVAANYGPHTSITSLGVLQGEEFGAKFGPHEDKALAIANFIKDFSANAQEDTCTTLCEKLNVTPYEVYTKYAEKYAAEIEAGSCASLEAAAALLKLDYPPVEPTTAPETTEEPTTEPVTTEPPTTEPETTEPVTTEPPTTEPVTTEPPTTEPVTTEPPTTEPPTTEPPTTEPVTTEPPTTEPVTTEPETTEPTTVGETKYYIAGDEGLVGVQWDPAGVELVKGEYTYDGAAYDYSVTFNDVAAGSYAFKVTDGTWTNCWGKDGGNFTVNLTKAADVTVYFNSESKAIAVESDGIGAWEFEYITAAGNGDGAWLNGANWDPADETNIMTEVEPGIWEITYTDVPADNGYEVKFACNGGWQPYNWTITGELDGQTNTPQTVEVDGSTVTLRIDVTGFDFATGVGTVKPEFIVTPPTPVTVKGDVDRDGELTVRDATALQFWLAKLSTDDELDLSVADYDGNGKINIVDVTKIQIDLAEI